MSPTGFVPFLQCHSLGSTTIGDSLAICEFLAESSPELHLWPRDRQLRAQARSAAAQMHSGFSALRASFSTNFLARYTGNVPISAAAQLEIVKMLSLWGEARKSTKEHLAALGEADEGFLFGGFSIADAFFWPVLWVCFLIYYLRTFTLSIIAISIVQSSARNGEPGCLGMDGTDVEGPHLPDFGSEILSASSRSRDSH